MRSKSFIVWAGAVQESEEDTQVSHKLPRLMGETLCFCCHKYPTEASAEDTELQRIVCGDGFDTVIQ